MSEPSVYGVGSDLVEIARFRDALARRPRLRSRLFSGAELVYAERFRQPVPHLAARFGAKEAVMKALGVGLGALPLRDIEVTRSPSGQPAVVLHGAARELAETRGVTSWRLSLSHTSDTALATAVALR